MGVVVWGDLSSRICAVYRVICDAFNFKQSQIQIELSETAVLGFTSKTIGIQSKRRYMCGEAHMLKTHLNTESLTCTHTGLHTLFI